MRGGVTKQDKHPFSLPGSEKSRTGVKFHA